MKEPWRPTPGDMIQCWDTTSYDGPDSDKITEHGKVGYVVRLSKKTDTFISESGTLVTLNHIEEGGCSKCIFFTDTGHDIVHVNHAWLRKITNSNDIRKVEDA